MAAGCPALPQETTFAIGFATQDDLQTGNTAAGLKRVGFITTTPLIPTYVLEDNSEESGNGDEFASNVFPVSRALSGQLEAYLTSFKMAQAAVFGLGAVAKTGEGPYVYTCTFLDRATDGCDLPAFSILQEVQGGTVDDRLMIGNIINGFEVTIESGPGRASSKIMLDIEGIGKVDASTEPDMPSSPFAEFLLSNASLAMTVLGSENLVSAKRVNRVRWGIRNNRSENRMFYPGSGIDANGFALGGRMQPGKREAFLDFNVDFDSSQTEIAKLEAQTEGTVVIGQTATADEKYVMTAHRVRYAAVSVTNNDGALGLDVECRVLRHSSNGVMTVVATTALDGIGEDEP